MVKYFEINNSQFLKIFWKMRYQSFEAGIDLEVLSLSLILLWEISLYYREQRLPFILILLFNIKIQKAPADMRQNAWRNIRNIA
uniref:Uncharacterized protein n=1 Tax=Heterorhabditis bacteriophora TaxID=37862 RepID=A0A1I7WLZ3_HETBA